jgi:hypothetical protein
MSDYLDLALTADATELYQDGIEAIQAQAGDDWEPSPPEAWILSAVARMAVEVVILAGSVPLEIFKFFGQSVLRIPALDATVATGTVEFTVIADPAGRTIDAGTEVSIDEVGFQTAVPLLIAPAATTGQVAVTALTPGAVGSGLTGTTVELVSPTYVWVDAITLVGITTGGQDGETGQGYVDRLADELPTLSPKAIYTEDYAILARRDLSVTRALAINRYIPAGPGGTPAAQTDVEGAVTVVVHDAAGADPGAPVRQRVTDSLTGARVRGVVVNVIGPTFTRLDVRFTAHADPGSDPAAVEADAVAALTAFLSPTGWGRIGAAGWQDEPVVYRNNLIGAVENVEGVRRVDTLTLARYGDAQGTADITLDGPGALPAADTAITGTVDP